MRCGGASQADWFGPRPAEVFTHGPLPPDLPALRGHRGHVIDSTGVRVLIQADRACARSGSRLVVLAGDGPARRVLDLGELDGRLAVVTDHPSPAAQRVAVIDTGPMAPPPPKLIPGAG